VGCPPRSPGRESLSETLGGRPPRSLVRGTWVSYFPESGVGHELDDPP
jgi:hypothetical protein